MGFKDAEESGDEEVKDNSWNRKDQHAKTIFRPAQKSEDGPDVELSTAGKSLATLVNGGQLTITKMAKQAAEKKENEAKKRIIT